MTKQFLLATSLFFFINLLHLNAQPNTLPAAGHEWILMNTQSYSNGPASTGGANGDHTIDCGNGSNTTTCGSNDTSFGWDIQCMNSPSTVLGTPGANFIQAQAFGNIGTTNNLELIAVPCNPGIGGTNPNDNWPSATQETRRVTLNNWNNLHPDTALEDGATAGTVWMPTSATLTFRDDGIGDGTGAGADELKFLVIGGNNDACSSWEIIANYNLSINAGPYATIVGTSTKIDETIVQTLSNVPDAGTGNTYHATDDALHNSSCGGFQGASWYFPEGINTGSFGTGFSQSFDILSDLLENGSSFTIDFNSAQSIQLNRTNGNSDAKVTLGPGMGGKVELLVNYQIWEILAPLPVELIDFSLTKKGTQTVLNWTTLSEINSDYFTIQRSDNSQDWEDLYQIATGADSHQEKHYSYLDQAPKQRNYYRLKQVDINQNISYSEIKTITFSPLKDQLVITPNPFSTTINISGKKEYWDIIEIIDQRGQLVLRTQSEQPNLSHLYPGLYFCLFKKENGALLHSKKLLKSGTL